ncbi:MAG: SAM-dependent methyltransferase [Methyloceanibacter sp.]|jgi:23S rRNA (cytidine1920-2'-O)/16S rRNA (cytidine1409-2'-O)-methyltransferase
MRGLSKSAGVSPFVSRGGIKLAAAFDAFGLDPKASSRSIIGASTGGFTEVLLECGAAQVFAVDVGSDQLHAKLRGNPRVVALGKD